jgi:hypothetical protein
VSIITFLSKARVNGSKRKRINKTRDHFRTHGRTDSWRNFNTCAGEIASPSGLDVHLVPPGYSVTTCAGGVIDGPSGPTPETRDCIAEPGDERLDAWLAENLLRLQSSDDYCHYFGGPR